MITSTTAAAVSSGSRGGARMGPGRVEFDEFVAARSTALLRTAYLLTHDHGLAEDLGDAGWREQFVRAPETEGWCSP